MKESRKWVLRFVLQMNISDSKLLIKVKIAADLGVAFTVPTLCYCCCSQHFTLSMYKSVVEIEGEREWWWWFSNNNIHNITYIYILLFVCCSFQPLKIDYYHRLKRQNHLTWHWWIFNFFFTHKWVRERKREKKKHTFYEKTFTVNMIIFGCNFFSLVCVSSVLGRERKNEHHCQCVECGSVKTDKNKNDTDKSISPIDR